METGPASGTHHGKRVVAETKWLPHWATSEAPGQGIHLPEPAGYVSCQPLIPKLSNFGKYGICWKNMKLLKGSEERLEKQAWSSQAGHGAGVSRPGVSRPQSVSVQYLS